MIRIAIVAGSGARGRAIAEWLADDDRFEIAEGRAADVMLVAGSAVDQIPDTGIPTVVLSDEAPDEPPLARSVRAWLPAGASPAQIVAALVAAASDLSVMTAPQVRQWLRPGPPPAAGETLTRRELQVLRMLADGLENKEVARQLNISEHTAKFHVAQILAKLRASGRAEAVAIGMRRGMVPI